MDSALANLLAPAVVALAIGVAIARALAHALSAGLSAALALAFALGQACILQLALALAGVLPFALGVGLALALALALAARVVRLRLSRQELAHLDLLSANGRQQIVHLRAAPPAAAPAASRGPTISVPCWRGPRPNCRRISLRELSERQLDRTA